ncbi:hypothetical protein Lal_00020499 [Lupinus albus]|nr:hypothetical protein Lal_00020499 [Lupinus albus]
MSDVNDIETVSILTPEFLNTLSTYGLLNHKIKLKVGTPIMLLRNLDQAEGLCNGTRLVVTRMTKHVLEPKIMSGKNTRNIIYIPCMSMSQSQSPWPLKMIRRQFSIVVSYALTIVRIFLRQVYRIAQCKWQKVTPTTVGNRLNKLQTFGLSLGRETPRLGENYSLGRDILA